MNTTMTPQQLLTDSEIVYNHAQVQNAMDDVALNISQELGNAEPIVLAVMGGAVYFAGQLLAKLTFPLHFDYVQASRYGMQTSGAELIWKVEPPLNVQGRVVLILDDILDQGITLAAIKQKCLDMGAKQVKIAVLFEKVLPNKKPVQADYVGLQVPDRYVFGCGMDVYGWWRNLPEVRALR